MDDSIGSIRHSLDALSGSCLLLEKRCDSLDWALTEANRKLKDALDEKATLASKLDGILRCLSAGVIAVDRRGRLIEFNPAAEQITGYRRGDLLGTPYTDRAGRGVGDRLGPLQVLLSGEGVDDEEKSIVTAAGKRIPVRFSTSPILDDQGLLLGAVEVFTDLRKTKILEEELLRTRTAAAIGEMAADVARQIRNPLAGISGFAELLERDLDTDPQRRELVAKIRQGVAAVECAVVRLLESAAPVTVEFRRDDVVAVTEKVLDLFESAVASGRSVKVVRSMCPFPAVARLNAEQFGRALRNVLVNAWEAMPDGGVIEVSIDLEEKSPAHRPGREEGERFVRVTVADSGEWMGDDVAANAFSPFFTTREKRLGLGLTSAKRIVTGHGGEISLEPNVPSGTKTLIRIPAE